MDNPTHKKNLLSIGVLMLCLTALQSPMWRPHAAPRCITVAAGGSAVVESEREIEKAGILEKHTATPTVSLHRVVVHGVAPGRTSLVICSKDGATNVYEVVVLAATAVTQQGLRVSR